MLRRVVLLDAAILAGLAYGVWRRSRVCALLLLVYAIANEVYLALQETSHFSILRLIFISSIFVAPFSFSGSIDPVLHRTDPDLTMRWSQRARFAYESAHSSIHFQQPTALSAAWLILFSLGDYVMHKVNTTKMSRSLGHRRKKVCWRWQGDFRGAGRKPESTDLNERHPLMSRFCVFRRKAPYSYHSHSAQWSSTM